MTDKQLYRLCKKYGNRALQARRKFAGLLPEVFKRRLFERRGYASIYEFAARLCGMSREQVDTVLRLEKKFEELPVLHGALVKGEISANKLVRIATIATSANQAALAEKAEILSSRALEVFVREVKTGAGNSHEGNRDSEIACLSDAAQKVISDDRGSGDNDGSIKPQNDIKSLHVQELQLAPDVENELLKLQEKGIDVNAFLRKCLEQRKRQIEEEKIRLARVAEQERAERETIGMPTSRYVPASIRKIILEEHGTKCSRPDCEKPAEQIHHEKRFAEVRLHDPRFLTPLCIAHHELEHVNDQQCREFRRPAFG